MYISEVLKERLISTHRQIPTLPALSRGYQTGGARRRQRCRGPLAGAPRSGQLRTPPYNDGGAGRGAA